MNENQTNFSEIPALGDEKGLETYLNNESLKQMGLEPAPQQTVEPTVDPAAVAAQQPVVQPTAQPTPQNTNVGIKSLNTANMSQAQVQQIMAQINEINAKLNANSANVAPQPMQQPMSSPYTPQERAFINTALQKGYSMEQINATIVNRRNSGVNQQQAAMEQRMANLENYLRSQEYKQAETAFITKLSDFGNKWGLSEQDLVIFGQQALNHGINIAMPNTDLETIFRAVFPEQYAIRAQRMQPTSTSQIYGGTSVPEGNRTLASKQEDAYVEAFMRQNMPNYGKK